MGEVQPEDLSPQPAKKIKLKIGMRMSVKSLQTTEPLKSWDDIVASFWSRNVAEIFLVYKENSSIYGFENQFYD